MQIPALDRSTIQQLANQDWSCIIKDNTILSALKKLGNACQLQNDCESRKILYTEQFADTHRHGLRVQSAESLIQMDLFLQGLLFHFCGSIHLALAAYTESLQMSGSLSESGLRLVCLESIAMIISEQQEEEMKKKFRRSLTKKLTKNHKSPLMDPEMGPKWSKKAIVHQYLSHHYIQRRSFVFIIDNEYQSIIFRDMAFRRMREFYHTLQPDDYVGFLMMGSKAEQDQVILEKKSANKHIKERVLNNFSRREPEFVLIGEHSEKHGHKSSRLERALE